jgi:hypothetical protein
MPQDKLLVGGNLSSSSRSAADTLRAFRTDPRLEMNTVNGCQRQLTLTENIINSRRLLPANLLVHVYRSSRLFTAQADFRFQLFINLEWQLMLYPNPLSVQ